MTTHYEVRKDTARGTAIVSMHGSYARSMQACEDAAKETGQHHWVEKVTRHTVYQAGGRSGGSAHGPNRGTEGTM